MAALDIVVRTSGVAEASRELEQLRAQAAKTAASSKKGNEEALTGFQKVSNAAKTFKANSSQLAETISSTASLMSFMARGNDDLRRKLEAVAITTGAASAAIRFLGSAMQIVAKSPLLLIATGLAAIIGAGVALIKNWEKVKEVTIQVWTSIANFFKDFWTNMVNAAKGFHEIIAGAISLDPERIEKGWNQFREGISQMGGQFKDVGVAAVEAGKQGINALVGFFENDKKLSDEKKRLDQEAFRGRLDLMNFEIEAGRATLEQKLAFLEEESQKIKDNKDLFIEVEREKLKVMDTLLNDEIKLRNSLEKTEKDNMQKSIERIREMAGLTKSETLTLLRQLREEWKGLGKDGTEAFKELEKTIRDLTGEVGTFGQQVRIALEEKMLSPTRAWVGAVTEVNDAWVSTFQNMFVEGTKFKDAVRNLFTEIKNIILRKLAEIAANYLWTKLFNLITGAVSGGSGGGGGGFGSFVSTAGNLVGATGSGGGGGGFLSTIGSALGLTGTGSTAGAGAAVGTTSGTASGTTAASGAASGAGVGTSAVSTVAGAATAVLAFVAFAISADKRNSARRRRHELYRQIAAERARIEAEILLAKQEEASRFAALNSELDKGGIGFGEGTARFARGAEFITQGPTAFIAGEAGSERVSIGPASKSRDGTGGSQVVFQGPVIFDSISMTKWLRKLKDAERGEARRFRSR
ncbi:hypothetical protein C4564_02105 [Candidatus Microgenomates bacterium]|nr:MAG: hypothetical protein C4564_02105 [Candidatus Microgenomates bacterium]